QITKALQDIAPRFEHRLFLSATPHNGHSNSFSALLEILDPQRFCRGVPVDQKLRNDVMVRRLKDDLREIQGGFPKRDPMQIDLDNLPDNTPELRLAALLEEYRLSRQERLKNESKRKQATGGLLITGLQQRLLSSIEAFAQTLRVHQRTAEKLWKEELAADAENSQPTLSFEPPDSDEERGTLSEDEQAREADAQMVAATRSSESATPTSKTSKLIAREKALLSEMMTLAESSRGKPDARVKHLLEWIREKMCPKLGKPGATWTDIRILIFTEYDDTKRYLYQQLQSAIENSDQADRRIEIYHGPTPPEKREEIKKAFNTPPDQHPVRILIATDAAREGLNLQAHCYNLFHFDIPWNPSRMEQRNGRIDRKLQPQPVVYCHYFVYKQRPEDRILATVVRKTETIRKELGSLAQVIDSRLTQLLNKGIHRDQEKHLLNEINSAKVDPDRQKVVNDELECDRARQQELRQQIDKLRELADKSKASTGLSETSFRATINCALEMIGAKSMAATGQHERFIFPALDQRSGGDASWADTLDSLRVPRERDQTFWEWRRTAPIRPVIFEDAGVLDNSAVHLHLEQRVVQRLLSRFMAQGLVHHDLSRACLTQANDAIPRIVLLGRLCLYGSGAARLHEELLTISARWTDPQIRKSPPTPYGRDAETKTIQLLQESLAERLHKTVPKEIAKQLQASAQFDVAALLPHLEARGKEHAQDAIKKLKERGAAEAKAMKAILNNQQKHIEKTVKAYKNPSELLLAFPEKDEELRQLQANQRYWEKRLLKIFEELETEPQRIKDVYEVQATRIEPVGLVYLWPVTG
ncbi:MAG: DEAD/DEAH box helicase, partial [Planctomycetia bacterium]|nr:DEAD/DEAH box helicase [Planctomycetia bacterium]